MSSVSCRMHFGPMSKRLWRDEDGSELLEVALALPVLLMLTYGVLQILLFLYCYVAATYSSRLAVRYATQHGAASLLPCTAIDTASIVQNYVFGIPANGIAATTTWSPNNTVGSTVTIRVTLSYAGALGLSGFTNLSATTTASGVILQ